MLSKRVRIKNFFSIFVSILLKKIKIKGDPIILMIEPSSRCNLRCPMCPRQLIKKERSQQDMAFENFKKIIDELCDTLMFLALWNYGEPLLNEKIIKMVEYTKKKEIAVALSTNVVLLTKNISLGLIEAGLDFLIVPLDGATKSTYEMYRKNAIFEQVIDNIRWLMIMRKKMKKNTPLVDLQFIIMKNNEHEIKLFRDLAKKLRVDMITLKKINYVKGQEREFLPQNRNFICDFYSSEINYKYCNRLSLSSVINSNGDVTVCCSDISFQYIVGNVFEEVSFRKIWNNEKYQNFRKKAYDNLRDIDICHNCGCANFDTKIYI